MIVLLIALHQAWQTPWSALDPVRELSGMEAPRLMALSGSALLVYDMAPPTLHRFSDPQSCQSQPLFWPSQERLRAAGLAAGPREVFLSDPDRHAIWRFSEAGQCLDSWQDFQLLNQPTALLLHGENLLVLERSRNEVLVLDGKTGQPLAAHPLPQDCRASSLAMTPMGLAVSDVRQHRILLQQASGWQSIGQWGEAPGFLDQPAHLFWQDGLLVTETANHRVQLLCLDGRSLGAWGSHELWLHQGLGFLHYPEQALPWPAGQLSILEPLEGRVQVLNYSQSPSPGNSNTKPHFGPYLSAGMPQFLFASDPAHYRAMALDLRREMPILVHQWGSRGPGPSQFRELASLAFFPGQSRLATLDAANGRIQWFHLRLETQGALRYDARMSRFDFSEELPAELPGEDLALFGVGEDVVFLHPPSHRAWLRRSRTVDCLPLQADWGAPSDAELGPNGEIWILDGGKRRIQVFSEQGQWQRTLAPPGLQAALQPFGLACDEDGFVVSDTLSHHLLFFAPDGSLQQVRGGWGSEPDRLIAPQDLLLAPNGTLVAVDRGNHRLVVMDRQGQWMLLHTGGRTIMNRPEVNP
jgi:hypothetical protein